MATKDVRFSVDARTRMLRGVEILNDAVRVTLGRRAAMSCSTNPTCAAHHQDGVTVAKEIELADKFENMGAQMVREVASKTNDLAGDGTTTATVLAPAIVREGVKAVAAGLNPMDLRAASISAVAAVVEDVKEAFEEGLDQRGDRAGRHHLGQWRARDRRDDRQGHGQGRQ